MDASQQKFISYFLFVGEQCGKAEEAITFYISLFKNSRLLQIERHSEGEDKEEAAGTVKFARFSLNGQEFMAKDSGRHHAFTFTPALSIVVQCETESEVDGLFQRLSEGGTVFMPLDTYPFSEKFGWVADKYGVSWQVNFRLLW
jgi:predicted 3-demethylubiquinone-9 3-methyltransferase (glyoxalase superfamily)